MAVIDLVEVVRGKVEAWISVWAEVSFDPRSFFASLDRADSARWDSFGNGRGVPTELSPLEFFWGSQIVTYLSACICAMWYFMDLNAPALQSHFDDSVRGFSAVSAIVAFAIVARLLALWLVGVVSFALFRWAGLRSELRRHLRTLYYLTNTDPLPAALATLVVMYQDPYINSPDAAVAYLRHSAVSQTLLVVWIVILVYGLVVSYFALGCADARQHVRRRVAFVFGFAPVFLTISAVSIWLTVRLIALAMVKNFD